MIAFPDNSILRLKMGTATLPGNGMTVVSDQDPHCDNLAHKKPKKHLILPESNQVSLIKQLNL